MNEEKNILILGIGNEVLGDESLALRLTVDLQQSDSINGADYQQLYLGGLSILECIEGYKTLIVLDTTHTQEEKPGHVFGMSVNNFKETLHLSSTHDVPFLTALEVGTKLGFRIPGNIFVIAVEIEPDLTLGTSLSSNIENQYDTILSNVHKLIQQYVSISKSRTFK